MVDLYKTPNTPAPRSQMFEAYDADGNKVQTAATQGDGLYGLSPDQQALALEEAQKPPTGEELAMALAMRPDFEKVMTQEEFLRYDDYMKTVETDWIEGIMTGAGMVVDEIGKGLTAFYKDDEKLMRAIPTLAEGFARGTRDMYGLIAQSADPQSPFFKFKELLTGTGSPEERFAQFKDARKFNRNSLDIMEGKVNVTDIDPDLINRDVAQALSYVADPSWAAPFVGQAAKASGLSLKAVGLARLSEQIAVVGAMTDNLKRMAMGGALKVAGAPLSLLGKAATETIEWGADRASGAFSAATGMAYQDARRVIREGGLYGGTIFRVPYMSTISDTYMAGWGAAGLGDAMGAMGHVIMNRKRGVFSYAEEVLANSGDMLSPQAKAMLRIINQADPILSYGYAAMDGMVTGAVIGGALGYGSARGEGAAQGIGMGAAMGAGGALMGRAWAGMARNGGIIHQRVMAEMEFVKNAMKDSDPEKLAQIQALEELAAIHGQDLSWQILGMLKLVPDVKLNVLDSVGFELQRRKNREGRLNGEDANDPLIGLDLDDPADIKKIQQFYNFEGMVVQRGDNGQITLHINADHYKKFTFGHELFHGIMRASPMQDEFIKDLREKLMGKVTPEGIELPGVIEPNKMRAFMERYVRAVYSNRPEEMEQRLRALDDAIKAYEADGTLIPGQDDARSLLDNMVEEAGAYYFSHMINGKDMDWLYRGGDLGGLRQVIDDAKEGLRNFFESKFASQGMDFTGARTLHESFLKGGVDGGKRIRIGALDALMTDIIRRQAGTQEGRMLDISEMNGEQQRRFRERNGLGDVLQPRKNGGMDNRRRTAAEESARAKQAVDVLRGMNQEERTSTTIVEKNGDVTIYGDLSDAELNQLVRVGVMMGTEAARYRLFRDTIANKGKGVNVFGGTLVGETFEVGEGRKPPRLRRSRGDKVPVTHREFTPIELRTEIKLTKGGRGKAVFTLTGLDIKNADGRLRELWFRDDVQKAWNGDYTSFAADFYRYLENISDPNGIPSAEFFGGGQSGSYKRNVFHEAFGAALKDGESPFNEPSPTYKGAEGRGEKFVIYSMTLGSMYDVKLRDRNVPYNHKIAYERIRRNWSPSEMKQEPMTDGEKLTHEESGYSFVKTPDGKWKAYDQYRRVVGISDNVDAATEMGRKAFVAEQNRIGKVVKNFSVNEADSLTAKGWAPAFFSAVNKFVNSGAITPNMSPEQVWARIKKANFAGIRADELRFLGLEARLLGGDNAHLQNARQMDIKIKELFDYSQKFASQDPAKLARVQEVAANLRRKQMEEQSKGVKLQREEQAKEGLVMGKPIGQAGLQIINKHLTERALGVRMVEDGTGYSNFVADGPREQDSYQILTVRSNQRTGVHGHFGDDVIVHIRVDERIDPVTGKKVLMVHEIQANNADQRNKTTPEEIKKEIEAEKTRLEEIKKDLEVFEKRKEAPVTKLVRQMAGFDDAINTSTGGGTASIAQSKYEVKRINVGLTNAEQFLKNILAQEGEISLSSRTAFNGEISILFSPEMKIGMQKEFAKIKKELLEILEETRSKKRFPDFSPGDSRYETYKALEQILRTTPYSTQASQTTLLRGRKLGDQQTINYDTEVILVSETIRRTLKNPYFSKRSDSNLDSVNTDFLIIKDGSRDIGHTNALKDNVKYMAKELTEYNYNQYMTGMAANTAIPTLKYGVFEGRWTQVIAMDLMFGASKSQIRDNGGDFKSRYDVVHDTNMKELLNEALSDKQYRQDLEDMDRLRPLERASFVKDRMFDASELGFIYNFIEKAERQNLLNIQSDSIDLRNQESDHETKITQLEKKLKPKDSYIMQTPQDWVVAGLKIAIRRAAERNIDTIVFTDHMGAPRKSNMEYVSSAKLYTEIIPTLGSGFLRQYGAKIDMPVRPKVYEFGGLDASGNPIVKGNNGGVSWNEQLGMKPQFNGIKQKDGSINYQVSYRESPMRPVQQQDLHLAQMKNNPRLNIPPELKRVALDEGFSNQSPNEGGEVPPREIPKGAKDISALGKESFATAKKKFDKAAGMYFRERETGRYFIAAYASWDGDFMVFEPWEQNKKLRETEDDAVRAQLEDEIQNQRIRIKPAEGSQGLGYRGIEDQVTQKFDSYSKNEPGAKVSDEAKPPAPDVDIGAIKTNGDAIKDSLTSLDGLEFTKDDNFRLFGRNTRKGREPGIINKINDEVAKAQRGEEADIGKIEESLAELEEVRDELQEKQENVPENLQETDAYYTREENIDALTEAIDEVRNLMEPPKGGGETRNMSVAENTRALPDEPYKGAASALSALELWAVAAEAGRLGRIAKINHKLVTPEVLKTVEWFLTNDKKWRSPLTVNRPDNFSTIADALKWVQETAFKASSSNLWKSSSRKEYKAAWLAISALFNEPTKKPRNPNVEPKAKDGASFDEWFDWARTKRVKGKSVATARNALKFIADMPREGYYKAVAQMLLAMGPVPLLDMQIYLTGRGFMRYAGENVKKLAISKRKGGVSNSDVSLANRIDRPEDSTVGVVIEEIMHGAQLTGVNHAPIEILKNLGEKGSSWKMGALKLITSVETDIKGKSYDKLSQDMKDRLAAARIAKLILEGTKGIEARKDGSDTVYDLHDALFGNVIAPMGVWRNEGDPSKKGRAGDKLRFKFQTKEQIGTNKSMQVNGYHFGNVAEFLVGLFSDPDLARFYFDKPPIDLSSLTPKGDPLRTSWRNLASQMIAVAMDFFNGLFGNRKNNLGSQFIEETVLLLQRQAEAAKNKDPANQINVQIGTNEVGFTREPVELDAPRQRGRQPSPEGEPIPMGMNQNEAGLAVVEGQETTRGNEVGPARTVVEGDARPIPRQGRGPLPRIGADQQLPAHTYPRPIPPGPPMTLTPIRWTGDAVAGEGIMQSTAGYMVMLIKGKWRVYNPEKQIIGVFNDEEKAKELADKRARRK